MEEKIASLSQEVGLFQLNTLKKLEELGAININLGQKILELETRVKTLEEARQRQIILNASFAVRPEIKIPKEVPKFKWPWH